MIQRTNEEMMNTLTHLLGVVFTLVAAGFILHIGYHSDWHYAVGVTIFTVGMLLMYSASTLYHWWLPGKGKKLLRIFDHIGIYIMIASSYTPICLGVVGGVLGWTVFALLWAVVVAGAFYKILAIGKYPRLSLFLYLLMGWSVVFIAKPVFEQMPSVSLWLILLEGLAYTGGTYFYSHDRKPYFHAVWHLFVLAGSVLHWCAMMTLLMAVTGH